MQNFGMLNLMVRIVIGRTEKVQRKLEGFDTLQILVCRSVIQVDFRIRAWKIFSKQRAVFEAR
jgi:hypothetical protein